MKNKTNSLFCVQCGEQNLEVDAALSDDEKNYSSASIFCPDCGWDSSTDGFPQHYRDEIDRIRKSNCDKPIKWKN